MIKDDHNWKGLTVITSRQPWGLFTPTGHRLLCSDGVVRAARLASTADTFFSVPASIRIKGKTVTGYMCDEESGEAGPDVYAHCFRHHDTHNDKLPPWPAKYTQEHARLIRSVHEEYDT